MNRVRICTSNKIVDDYGNIYNSIRQLAKAIHSDRNAIAYDLNQYGEYTKGGISYRLAHGDMIVDAPVENDPPIREKHLTKEELEEQREFEQFKQYKAVKELDFEVYDMKPIKGYTAGYRYAVALFSDAHIEESVKPETVNWLNEYNIDIAERRIKTYFANLANCLKQDGVTELIFGSLGDTISGYIHEELAQTNGLTPIEATLKAQSLIYSGLHYLCCEAGIKTLKRIRFVGIVGNHSRTTKKMQHANGRKMSYEWLMYQNIKQQCENTKLPIDFYIPDSDVAVVKTVDKRTFLMMHGWQIKGGGTNTVCGIYPALNRLSMKYQKIFHQDRIFLGHFHNSVNMPNAVVNGSVISYSPFSLANGFEYERPQQQYIVYDTNINGELLSRQIYCSEDEHDVDNPLVMED